MEARAPVDILSFGRTSSHELFGNVRVGSTAAHFEGNLGVLNTPAFVDGRLEVRGDTLDHLRVLLGVDVPATAPYLLKGRLRYRGSTWTLEELEGGW
jgi:hypothetical protein